MDIFDKLQKDVNIAKSDKKDLFDRIYLDIFDRIKLELPSILKKYTKPHKPTPTIEITDELVNMVRAEIKANVQNLPVQKVIEKVIEKRISEPSGPRQVMIKETIDLEVLEKKVKEEIKKKIDEIEKDGKFDRFVVGPLPLPNMENKTGQMLTTDGHNSSWSANPGSLVSGYVPYTGANADVDLGAYDLTTQMLVAKDSGGFPSQIQILPRNNPFSGNAIFKTIDDGQFDILAYDSAETQFSGWQIYPGTQISFTIYPVGGPQIFPFQMTTTQILFSLPVVIGETPLRATELLRIKDTGTVALDDYVIEVHAASDNPYLAGWFNDTYSTTVPSASFYGGLSGEFYFGTERSGENGDFFLYTNGYVNPRIKIGGSGGINFYANNLITTGNITIDSDTYGLILGDDLDATLKWVNADLRLTLNQGLVITNTQDVWGRMLNCIKLDYNLSTAPNSPYGFEINTRASTGGAKNMYSLWFDARYTGAQAQTGGLFAVGGQIYHTGAGTTGESYGGRFLLYKATNANAGTFYGLRTGGYIADTYTGTLTTYRGLNDAGVDAEDGIVTNAYNADFEAHKVDTGSLVNAYSIKLAKQTVGSTKNIGISLVGDSTVVNIANCGSAVVFGAGEDAAIGYDGTDLVLSPRIVGTGAVCIGVGAAGVDYQLKFNGETLDGTITWLEDEGTFKIESAPPISAWGNIVASDTTALAAGVGGGIAFMGYYTGTTGTIGALVKMNKTNATDGDYSFNLGLYSRLNGGATTERFTLKNTGELLQTSAVNTVVAAYSGLTINQLYNPASNDTTNTLGGASIKATAGGANNAYNITGVLAWAQYSGTGRPTNVMSGFNALADIASGAAAGTLVELRAGNYQINNNDADTIVASALGFRINTPVNAGTFTNTYGIYIASQTVGTQTNTPYGIYQAGTGDLNYFAGDFSLAGGVDFIIGTTTGTKIGTATNQLIGFYNATPVDQPTAVADATDAASVILRLNELLARIRELGLIAT